MLENLLLLSHRALLLSSFAGAENCHKNMKSFRENFNYNSWSQVRCSFYLLNQLYYLDRNLLSQ